MKLFSLNDIKNKVFYFLLFVILMINLYYFFWKKIQSKTNYLNSTSEEISSQDATGKIDDVYLHLENWKDTIALSDLVRSSNYLILRIPLVYCQDCEFSELENLRVLYEQYGFKNVCAIITVRSPRDLTAFSLAFDFKYLKLGSLKESILDIPEEKLKIPFYFVLNSELKATNFFIPQMENKMATFKYFNLIGETLLN